MPRLSHYFLPRLLFAKKQVLYLDGANQISPLLLARFARERGVEPSNVNSLIRVARAFTCFQLTELVRRVPRTLERFSADVLIVTAIPDLYFDEDVRDREARASFEHALEGLANVAPLSLSINSRTIVRPSPLIYRDPDFWATINLIEEVSRRKFPLDLADPIFEYRSRYFQPQ